jgi:eukaryotic-like serine/threonine-protein kinase
VTLTTGKHLGPYEILSLIGSGGMGEVYRARDARLSREVAIKVLPAQFSADPDRLRRFEQEARATGILNHPNILAVYDIGTEDGTVYVVSELLSGETLRERLGGSPIPVRKAIEYSLQIAHGLAAAHDKGIVHRDLKPENIYITKDGRVKILDFGLAKFTDQPISTDEHSKMATIDPGTRPGIVLGTVGYMSPEQIRNRPTDHRSDIFSLGLILYEMLTGQRAFQRDSTADTMSAILKEDPRDISNLNPIIPPSLERVVRHCLEKNPEERFQSARDLAFDLEMISGVSGTTPVPTKASQSHPLLKTALIALLSFAALSAAFYVGRSTVSKPKVNKVVPTEAGFQRLTYRRGYISAARFAPDGQSIVYSASWVGNPEELFITRPQNPVSRSLEIKGSILSISSTGEMAILLNPQFTLGWQRTGTLARLPIEGGAPREVLTNVQDADWSPDGKNLAIARITPDGYTLEYPIGKVLYKTTGWLNNIQISNDNKYIAFMDHPAIGDDRGTVKLIDLQGKVKTLTTEFASEVGLQWSLDGKEIWFTAGIEGSNEQPLYAVTLDGKRRVVAAMLGNLILHDIDSKGNALISRDSRRREIAILAPGETRERDMSWFDWSFARDLSEDGKTLVFEEEGAGGGPNYSVFIRNTDGSPAVKLGEGYALSLSPDKKYVAAELPSDLSHLTLLPTGPGEPKVIRIPGIDFNNGAMRWFNDNNRFVFAANQSGKPTRWWLYEISTSKVTPITPEGIIGQTVLVSPYQNSILARSEQGYAFYSPQGELQKEISALTIDDALIQWTSDGKGVFVVNRNAENPLEVYRVELDNGKRTLWKVITPSDPAGIAGRGFVLMTPDGNSYAYTYRRVLSDLYLVPNLQ